MGRFYFILFLSFTSTSKQHPKKLQAFSSMKSVIMFCFNTFEVSLTHHLLEHRKEFKTSQFVSLDTWWVMGTKENGFILNQAIA